MKLAVLGATGLTGRELVQQALASGHQVVALARDPGRIDLPADASLTVVRADVFEPESVAGAIAGIDALLSGLGARRGDRPDTLAQGAVAAVSAGPPRIVWLGALGTGESRHVAGPVLEPILSLALRREIPDKVGADQHVVGAGHTVVHAGRLTSKPATGRYRLVPAADAPRLWFPPAISRADAAALMLAEAETPRHRGRTVVALRR